MFLEREKKIGRFRKMQQAVQYPNSQVFHFSGENLASSQKGHKPTADSAKLSFLHEEIAPCLSRAKWLGNLPLYPTGTGVEFKWFSWWMLYSVAAYLGSLGLIVPTLKRLSNPEHYTSRFDEILFSEMYIAMFVPYLLTPVTSWLDSPHIATYFNSWVTFQKLYLEVVGKPLELNFRRWTSRMVHLNSINSLLPPCLWIVIPPNLTPLGAFTLYIYCLLYAFPMSMIWHYSCKGFEVAGQNIADSFQKELNDKVTLIAASKVNEFKRLWLKLSELPNELSYAMYRTYVVKTLVMFFCMTLSLYGTLNFLQNHDALRLGIFLSTFIFSLGPFYVMCNSAHWVPIHISEKVGNILKYYAPSEFHTPVRDEMNAFLQVTFTQKCSMNVGGYIHFDRQLLQAAGTTAVTYLIVLLQFKISLPEDEDQNGNKTLLKTN